MIAGTVYGVVLNDRAQLAARAAGFHQDPYKAPPVAPVLYIKPRACFRTGGAAVPVPAELKAVEIAPTVALLLSRDLSRGVAGQVQSAIGAACLALDVCELHDSYYRPAIKQRCREGFLPLGEFAPLPSLTSDIVTFIDGREAHRWSLSRLARSIEDLLIDVSAFMTLGAGDVLLVGLPGDAPRATAGQQVRVDMQGLPSLMTSLVKETQP
jgi:5-oxopent-3-ene-1,2,5-tricarboxylate decarboxylase/2-hydroxyhepta-2,4-diene-1,7-dioate isomerase